MDASSSIGDVAYQVPFTSSIGHAWLHRCSGISMMSVIRLHAYYSHITSSDPTIETLENTSSISPTSPSPPSLETSPASNCCRDISIVYPSNSTNSFAMDVSNLLQLQTQAAYGSRPQPQPVQAKSASSRISGSSMTSTSSQSSSTTNSSNNCLEFARCSRCHRTLSMDPASPVPSGVVQFGTNLFYCSRCASMVGYKR